MRRAARIAFMITVAALAAASVPAADRQPRLIVLLAVDQMRSDYLDKFRDQWRGGLRRLVDEGAVFRQAAYSYFGTLTCAGHATLATGTVPSTHGMVLDGWWDRESGRRIRCTNQPEAKVVRYAAGGRGGDGPANLVVPTLADELRSQLGTAPRIVSFSLKARAAIAMAGQRADAVAWFDDGDAWVTSTSYTPAPVPFVAEFVARNPVERDLGKTWTPSLPATAYLYRDAESSPGFSYALRGDTDKPDAKFYTAWKTSPFADEYVAKMGMAAVDGLKLGRGPGTDYLALGFSGPDYIGHEFGPRSMEVQDGFVRLDATIGTLLQHLDRTVGRGEYVVAFSADHGVAPIPEWMVEQGLDAGRIGREDVVQRVNTALGPVLGPGKHAVAMTHIEFSFAPGVYEKLLANPEAMKTALDTIRAVPGVARVFRADELNGAALEDPLARQVARGYYPGRSGDLVIVPRPYWYTWNRGADHGTGYLYDVQVPLIMMGKGIQAGTYLEPADPIDIAPTLAFLTGVTLGRAEGRVLKEAIAPVAAPAPRPSSARP